MRSGEYVKDSTVSRKQAESLADYVKRVRHEKKLSLTDVQLKSENQIASSYVSKIENDLADPEGVTPKKLAALAKGLDVSPFELFAVVIGVELSLKDEANLRWARMRSRLDEIPEVCQDDVEALVDTLWERRRVEGRAERIAAAAIRKDPSKAAARLPPPLTMNSPDNPTPDVGRAPRDPKMDSILDAPERDSQLGNEPRDPKMDSILDVADDENGNGSDAEEEGRQRKNGSR